MLSCLRNALIAVGAYWLSTWAVAPLTMLFGKITNHIVYGDSILAAILMGVMLSLGRAVAAAAAGICVTLIADSKRPEFWAIVPTVLYATRGSHWSLPPSTWYHMMQNVEKFFPAFACIAAALLVARFRHRKRSP